MTEEALAERYRTARAALLNLYLAVRYHQPDIFERERKWKQAQHDLELAQHEALGCGIRSYFDFGKVEV